MLAESPNSIEGASPEGESPCEDSARTRVQIGSLGLQKQSLLTLAQHQSLPCGRLFV
ncbi:hypothetical protein [Mastigocladopsis repens]|uniref:hypothetical protein n=1 Tax=Mastigocladopsis repens TaxID=221287 RepID=UPI00031FF481|nr:hypothetical protein [Mastigocladopsis repens]